MSQSSTKKKPQKPYPDFPLFPHATGRWAKKIRGKFHYFGKWDDPRAALDRYLDQRDDLHAGRTPRVKSDGLTIRELCNRFMTSKRHLLDTGELGIRTFRDYFRTCNIVVKAFGKNRLVEDVDVTDFEQLRKALSKTRGPYTLGTEVSRIRSVFKYAYDQGLIDRPIRYGQSFKKPSAQTLRRARAKNGARMFEADELRTIIDAASQPMKTFVLLGINCGYGQTDIANLTNDTVAKAIETGWLDFARSKTGIERRCSLWPETIVALRDATAMRPKPKDRADAKLAFITQRGRKWVRADQERSAIDSIGKMFGELLCDLQLKRPRLNFYAIRHTFETIAGESRDQVAVNSLMGHVDSSMSAVYRERISDERLQAVVDVVHDWLSTE